MELTPDLLISIIKYLLGTMGAIIALFISVVGILHRSMTKRLDLIEVDIKPVNTQLAVHTEQIKEIKVEQGEVTKWLNHHDGRIQKLERKVVHLPE